MAIIDKIRGSRTRNLLLGAIVLGLVAAGLSLAYLKSREEAIRESLLHQKARKVAVVVASHDLTAGAKVENRNLAIRQIPRTYVSPNALTPANIDRYRGRVLVQPVASGRQVLTSFVKTHFPTTFSGTIPQKRRAMTIQVDEVNSISGLIRPGDHIDIFANMPAGSLHRGRKRGQEQASGKRILPVLQNVTVLATGKDASKDYREKLLALEQGSRQRMNGSFSTLTISVTPKQGAWIAVARDVGDLIAMLRNRRDNGLAKFTEVSARGLLQNAGSMLQDARSRASQGNLGNQGLREITADDVTVREDGTVVTKDGTVLKGVHMNKDGQLVNKKGEVVDKVVATKDGTVLQGDGLSVNEDGQLVNKDGTVVPGDSVSVNEDGQLVTPDGKVVDANELKKNASGQLMTKNGELVGQPAAGGTQTREITADDVVVRPDGTVVTRDGKVLKGVHMNDKGQLVNAQGQVVDSVRVTENAPGGTLRIDFIVGGEGENGVAKVVPLPVLRKR